MDNTILVIKLVFFVRCRWENGGYENTHYFQTEKQAREWVKAEDERLQKIGPEYGVEIRRIEKVPIDKFAEDYMGGCL